MANWAQKLKLQHLQTLIALGEQGNLTHVARMMNITQPALSKWLSQLEDEIGITSLNVTAKACVLPKAASCYCSMPNACSMIWNVRNMKSPVLSKAAWWEV